MADNDFEVLDQAAGGSNDFEVLTDFQEPGPTPSPAQQDIGRMTAFARSTINSTFGGFGDRILAATNPHQDFQTNLTEQRRLGDAEAAQYPTQTTLGTVVGMGLGGIMGGELANTAGNAVARVSAKTLGSNAVKGAAAAALRGVESMQGREAALLASKVGGSEFFQNLPKTITEIAMLGNEGGISAIGLNRADDLASAAEAYKTGASLTTALGIAVKGVGAGFSAFANTSSNKAAKAAFEYGKETGDFVLNNATPISERVAALPDHTLGTLNAQVSKVTDLKNARVARLASQGVEVPIDTPLKSFHDSLGKLDKFVGEKDAVADARALINQYEDTLTQGGQKKAISIADADKAKQELQKEWLKGGSMYKYKGTKAYNAFKSFERDLRDGIASIDPKIGNYNDVSFNLLNAADDLPSSAKFEAKALSPDKPSTIAEWREFHRHFAAKEENAKSYGDKFHGFKNETLKDPETAKIISDTRNLIDMEIQPALKDYYVLKQVDGSNSPNLLGKLGKVMDYLPTPAASGNRLGQAAHTNKYFAPIQKKITGNFMKGIGRSIATQGPTRLGLTAPTPSNGSLIEIE